MRSPVLIAASLMTAGWLAACSAPASDGPKTAERDIRLAEPSPETGPAAVSDLEARRTLKPPPARAPVERQEAAPVAPTETVVEPELAPATVAGELVAPTSVPAATPPAAAAETDEAPEIIRAPAMQATTPGEGGMMGGDVQPWGDPRGGPVIIIRGGRGGPDDHCDLGRPGIRGRIGGRPGGIAINRITPLPRAGARPRGGIR